jgi:HlyD family secretion protein
VIGADGQPTPVAVKIGVSDDNSSALLQGTLTEGRQVIVGVTNSQNKAGYFGIRLGF